MKKELITCQLLLATGVVTEIVSIATGDERFFADLSKESVDVPSASSTTIGLTRDSRLCARMKKMTDDEEDQHDERHLVDTNPTIDLVLSMPSKLILSSLKKTTHIVIGVFFEIDFVA